MEYVPINIIEELDFVLTHPSCNVAIIEKFYHNCLIAYDEVPILTMVYHMRKAKPILLKQWAEVNTTVHALLNELEPNLSVEENAGTKITVNVDIAVLIASQTGIYQVAWESTIEEAIVNAHFKTKSLHVIDKREGKLVLVGVSKVSRNHYHLYLKKGRHSK